MSEPNLDDMPFWNIEDIKVEPWTAPDASEIILPCDDIEYDDEDLMLKWLSTEDKREVNKTGFDKEMFNYE